MQKKELGRISMLFMLTYMISYITRINYGAIIVEMESTTGFPRSLLSLALTGNYITYGTGQIVFGILGDRLSPKKMISSGFIVTILMNVLIPFCTGPYQMLIVWCINGFAQSMMWPPLVRLMTERLSDEEYKEVSVKVSWGSSLGTIFVYLVSPMVIAVAGWKWVFFVSASMGILMLLLWQKFAYDVAPRKEKKQTAAGSGVFAPIMLAIMFAIVLHGVLRDGVVTWMPSYISETYNLPNTIAILTGIVLPIFSIINFRIAGTIHEKKIHNPVKCAGAIFALGAVSAIGLYGFLGTSATVSVVFSAVLAGCMSGVNLMLICMIPAYFKKRGNVATISGIVNATTYIGGAISSYGVATISEKFGWSITLLIWMIIAIVGTAICLCGAKAWRRFQRKIYDE